MTEPGHNRLAELAGLIKAAHADALQSAKRTAERALNAGSLLLEAKGALEHGKWAGWLRDNVGFSERSAQRYMQLAKSGLESATVAGLGIRGAAEVIARKRPPCPSYLEDVPEAMWPIVRVLVAEGRNIRAAEASHPGLVREVLDACVERRVTHMREALESAIEVTLAGERWSPDSLRVA